MKETTSIWSRDFMLHTGGYLLMACSFYYLLPTLPLYVVNHLGEDNSKVGYIIGIYALSALLIRPFSGYAFDVYGRKRVYLFSFALYVLVITGYFLASTFLLLLMVRFLHGISWGFLTTGGSTIAADLVPPGKRGEGIGYFGLSFTVSMAIGPVLAFQIMGDNDFFRLFMVTLLTGGLAFVLANLTRYPEVQNLPKKIAWDRFFEPRVLKIGFILLVTTFSYSGIFSFITVYGMEIGIKNSGTFFLVYAAGVSIFRPMAGKLMDRHGPSGLILMSIILSIAGLILLTLLRHTPGFLGSAFIIGIGHGIVMPVLLTMTINMVEPESRGRANSTFFSAADLGFGGGSIVLGYVAEAFSLTVMYWFCAALLIIPLLYFYLIVLSDYRNKIELSVSHE